MENLQELYTKFVEVCKEKREVERDLIHGFIINDFAELSQYCVDTDNNCYTPDAVLEFDGKLFLRGEEIATIDLYYEPSDFEHEGNHCDISYIGKEEEEDNMKEIIEQLFYQNVVHHHNMAWRE